MYKLIAIDLDGTLLNSQKNISDRNKDAILEAVKKGIRVIICSGRIYKGVKGFAGQMQLREPIIACNGAIIRDSITDNDYYYNPLSSDDCYKIIDICHHAGIYFHAYIGDVMYVEEMDYSALYYSNKNKELPPEQRAEIELVESIKETIDKSNKSPTKIVVISNDLNELANARKQIDGISTIKAMSSNYNNFEIVNCEVNKGNALKILSEKLGISKEQIMAIGDNENDYSMIKYAGLGVAMGNAEDEIKEIADYITLNNDEDGVAEAISKFAM